MLLIVVAILWLAMLTLCASLCRVAAYEDSDAIGGQARLA
jgi:hypothetical protein